MTAVGHLGYPLHERTLGNGLRVIVNPDHAVPIVAVNLWYDVGSRDERPGRTGLAHLFEHVMFQGSANVASGDHLNLMQSAGAACNATTWFDRTNYFEAVPVGALDLALWLEADRMGHLLAALTQANLDTQREVVKEEKRQRYDNAPYGDMIDHLLTLSFPEDHPYRHTVIGSMADLDAASLADTHDFFSTWYSPGNAVLTLAGDIEPDDGFARAERYFGHLPGRALPARTLPAPLAPHVGVPRAITEADVPASTLYLSWRTPKAGTFEADATEIALEVLGGSETSRLHRRLVRTDGTCSTAGSGLIGLAWGNSLGFALARALDDADLGIIEAAVCDEIDRLCDEGPSPDELERVRVQFERAWLSECARMESRADLISQHATMYGDAERVNRRIADFFSIDADAVREAARAHLSSGGRAVLEYHRTATAKDVA